MKRTRAQIKAEISKRFEAELNQLLNWQEKAKRPNLTQFENEILAARKEISIERLMAMLLGEQAGIPCVSCLFSSWVMLCSRLISLSLMVCSLSTFLSLAMGAFLILFNKPSFYDFQLLS